MTPKEKVSIIDRKDFYEYNDHKGGNKRTRKRLQELEDLGLTEMGIASFGIEGIMSGLYIESVWYKSDKDWTETVQWIKDLKDGKIK